MKSEHSIPHVTATQLKEDLASGACQLIDVREPLEHAESHVAGAHLIPLGDLEKRCDEIDRQRPVVVMCQAGKRGAQAVEKLRRLGFIQVANLEGGILTWKAAGLPCARGNLRVLPLMRQVQIVAGGLVLLGSLLTAFVDTRWVCVPMFIGAGLLFAGLSGFCGLALLLARMPWNRVSACNPEKPSCCA
ncbi:MAG: rhodanese-like domain-containing protein [Prosthecobacter sp.]